MRHLLQRHPIPIKAWFRHSLVLTYALPADALRPLLPPGLVLDTFGDFGFVAVAMVQTRSLRPAFLPQWCGQDFFLAGYRIFTRFRTRAGRTLRGLRILRSDADHVLMVHGGNLLTHYQYRRAQAEVCEKGSELLIRVTTPAGEADVEVRANLANAPAAPPPGSPFPDWHQARLFAGPLPFTFDYESQTHSIIIIEGVREDWQPKPVAVTVEKLTFLDHPPFRDARPVLANAFHVANISYAWKRGVREPLVPVVQES
jgi:hypothetical protein